MLLCEKVTPNGGFVQPGAASGRQCRLTPRETRSGLNELGILTSCIDRRCRQLAPCKIGSFVHGYRNPAPGLEPVD